MSSNAPKKRGRPPKYTDATRLRLSASGKTKLQANSDRRAIVNMMIERGGVATIAEINAHFGFDLSDRAAALVRAGWLEVVE